MNELETALHLIKTIAISAVVLNMTLLVFLAVKYVRR